MPRVPKSVLQFVILPALLIAAVPSLAQQSAAEGKRAFTTADYAHAEKFMAYNTTPLVFHTVRATWLQDDRFWYRNSTPEGSEFVLVDAKGGTRAPAFDHARLAAALSAAAGTTYDASHLPFMDFEFSAEGQAISFNVRARRWRCEVSTSSILSG